MILLNDLSNEPSNFDTKNNIVNQLNIQMKTVLNFKQTIKLSLCNYSDAYIIVPGDILVAGDGAGTSVPFKTLHSS